MKWVFMRIKHGAVRSPLYSLGHYILFLDAILSELMGCFHYLLFPIHFRPFSNHVQFLKGKKKQPFPLFPHMHPFFF